MVALCESNRLEIQNQEGSCFRMPRRTSQNLGKGEQSRIYFLSVT